MLYITFNLLVNAVGSKAAKNVKLSSENVAIQIERICYIFCLSLCSSEL